jgi:small multidrug resistance family-3 protein
MEAAKVLALFAVTAVAEILGCYLPYLWLKREGSILLLIPAAVALTAFVWLLSLHPHAAGRTYAAYGGIYIVVALAWLLAVQRIVPDRWDLIGGAMTLAGMAIIYFGPRDAAG